MSMQEVILVNEHDQPIGAMDKMAAHVHGLLHRAFSVFIFNSRGDMLLQQRADGKYHSPSLWSNACCSHPAPGERTSHAAARRLYEELGCKTPLSELYAFTYKTEFDNGLTEHEFDHVFTGVYDGPLDPNPTEVKAVSYMPIAEISARLGREPEQFTAWFHLAFPRMQTWAAEKFGTTIDHSLPT